MVNKIIVLVGFLNSLFESNYLEISSVLVPSVFSLAYSSFAVSLGSAPQLVFP